jgi:hypothetical protein
MIGYLKTFLKRRSFANGRRFAKRRRMRAANSNQSTTEIRCNVSAYVYVNNSSLDT